MSGVHCARADVNHSVCGDLAALFNCLFVCLQHASGTFTVSGCLVFLVESHFWDNMTVLDNSDFMLVKNRSINVSVKRLFHSKICNFWYLTHAHTLFGSSKLIDLYRKRPKQSNIQKYKRNNETGSNVNWTVSLIDFQDLCCSKIIGITTITTILAPTICILWEMIYYIDRVLQHQPSLS